MLETSVGNQIENSTLNQLDNNVRNIKEEPEVKILEEKTQVQISANGKTDNIRWIMIDRPSNTVTLNDIKPLLMKNPKMYGMSKKFEYVYCVRTSKDGIVGFEVIHDENTILPLFGDKIVLQCWRCRL